MEALSEALAAKWLMLHPLLNIKVILIGCGGTGSKLAPEICQAVALAADPSLKQPLENVEIILVDHDVVEPKNLTRQHFIYGDLGRFKAQVLAERYASAFNLEVGYNLGMIDTADDVLALLCDSIGRPYHRTTYILFTAVDNHSTRRVVHEALAHLIESRNSFSDYSLFWIDLGNEATSGQMVIGFHSMMVHLCLPFVTEVYPEILEHTTRPSQLPCGVGGIQDLNINAAAAVHAASFFRKLLRCLASRSRTSLVNYHMVEFGVDPPAAVVRYITKDRLMQYQWLPKRQEAMEEMLW